MLRYSSGLLAAAVVTVGLFTSSPSWGVMPAAQLLPATTKLYVSFPNVEAFRRGFEKTQLGMLTRDPVMKPFAEDLGNLIRSRFGETGVELGLTWEDLEGVYGGEGCLAMIQPGGVDGKHATTLIIDVTNHPLELEKVLNSVRTTMQQRKATQSTRSVDGVEVTAYELQKRRGEAQPREVFFCVVNDQLIATNDADVAVGIIQRGLGQDVGSTLAGTPAFSFVSAELGDESGNLAPHIEWFLDPFGYVELVKSARGPRKRRGRNLLKTFQNQGFDAIKAAGGFVTFATEKHDVIHRTFVYAPAVTDQPTRYEKAARMLVFPNGSHIPTPRWIPRSLATFASFNWKVRDAFEFSTSLVDEIVDSPKFVDDVLSSLEKDPQGPQINLRTQLLDYFDEHVVMLSDYKLPISTTSERLLAAIRVTDEAKAAQGLRKLWETDPTAREREGDGPWPIWEIVPEAAEPGLDLDLPGIPGGLVDKDEEAIQLPNTAMTVAHGYLMVATHVDLLEEVLAARPPHDTLSESVDFKLVNEHLVQLGAGDDAGIFFSRTDEEYRSPYEMIRMGKMPESESLLGIVLNRLLGPDEKGVVREQELDGKNLPDYQVARRYLGPAGLFVKNRDDGWMVTGIVLSKQQLVEDTGAPARLQTASKD